MDVRGLIVWPKGSPRRRPLRKLFETKTHNSLANGRASLENWRERSSGESFACGSFAGGSFSCGSFTGLSFDRLAARKAIAKQN